MAVLWFLFPLTGLIIEFVPGDCDCSGLAPEETDHVRITSRASHNHVTIRCKSRHKKGEIRLKYKEVRRMVCRKQRPSTHVGLLSGPSSRNDSALLWLLFNHVTRFNDLSHVTAVMWRCLPFCVSLLTELVNLWLSMALCDSVGGAGFCEGSQPCGPGSSCLARKLRGGHQQQS